jgi:hypothetical protein
MISLVQTGAKILADPGMWEIPFMEFVDDFRRERNVAMLGEYFRLGDERFDALLAATVDCLCREQHLATPAWVADVPACRKPWFVAGVESIKAIALVESPVEFRMRKIFVLANFLSRL